MDQHNVCTLDDIEHLFRVGHSHTQLDRFFWTIMGNPPCGGTEASFHHFWDKNIREVVECLVPTGRSIRNSSEHTVTMTCHPDYAFLIDNLCPFQGEEQSPDSIVDPKQELADKIVWIYDPAPYVLGEVVEVTLICISHCCFDRLLCDRTFCHSGGDLPSTAGSGSPSCAEYCVSKSKPQSRPNQECLPFD